MTLVFEKNANFCRKLSKIAENCDHNIDPRPGAPGSSTYQIRVILEGEVEVGDPAAVTEDEDIALLLEPILRISYFNDLQA
jgi:MOSC domain-containing protein YiiM